MGIVTDWCGKVGASFAANSAKHDGVPFTESWVSRECSVQKCAAEEALILASSQHHRLRASANAGVNPFIMALP
jgi:hypothetical protein